MGRKTKNIKLKQDILVHISTPEDLEYYDMLRNLGSNILMSDYKVLGGINIEQDDEDDMVLSNHEWYMALNNIISSSTSNEEANGGLDRNIGQSNELENFGTSKPQMEVSESHNDAKSVQSNASETKDTSKERKMEPMNEDASSDKDPAAKMLKRKLKKQRQRERKQNEKLDTKENTKAVVETCIQETKNTASVAPSLDKEAERSKKDDPHENGNSDNNDDDNQPGDFDFVNNIPAFMSTVLKKSVKKSISIKPEKQNKKVNSFGSSKDSISEEYNATYTDNMECRNENDEEFICVKGKRTKQYQFSESRAIQAIEYIMKNNISLAIKCLSEAIESDPSQIYHYVNRSFCYLRSNEYSLAIADAQHVMRNTNDSKVLLKAKTLLAQALYAVKDYEHSERTLEECLSLAPHDKYLQRQLLRIRVLELISLGFPERISIYAIKDSNTISDAIDAITNNYADCEAGYCNAGTTCTYNENEVYYSDDEHTLSNTLLMSEIAR